MKNDFEQLLFAAENVRDLFYFLSDSVNVALYKQTKKSIGLFNQEIRAKRKELQHEVMSDYGFILTFSIALPSKEIIAFNKTPLEEEIAKIESFIERLRDIINKPKP